MVRHFRLKKCFNDQYTRVQFAVSDQITLRGKAKESDVEDSDLTFSKLELEQGAIQALEAMGGKLKLGTAPQGHLETLAQKLLDKSKKGKGKAK